MKKGIILESLIVLLILTTLLIVGCQKGPFNPFTSTLSLDEEGRMFSVSGKSAGYTAGAQSEFKLSLDNRSGKNSWQGEYCILLIDQEGIVEEITHEQFNVQVGQEARKPLTVKFPEDFKGPIGLCVVIPRHASMVTTLWVGEIGTSSAGPWPNITTCPHSLTEEGSWILADEFVRNSPTFVFDGIEESLVLKETVCLLKEYKPGHSDTLPHVYGWVFKIKFESRHAGYGDRSGQILAQAITPHEVVIMVEAGKVTSAITDGVWDMINQRILEDG
jgi:hypothetical protein